MEFNYTDTFYVEEGDIEYIVNCIVSEGYTIEEAIDDWSAELDDEYYYSVGEIEDQLRQVINDRINKIKNKKMLDK